MIRDETNSRIYDRNIPSQAIQPYFSPRPASTKYSLMPIVDPRKENSVVAIQYPAFNMNSTFNPGNTKSPWSGYASSINQESELKNQIFALQKCSQAVYVPSSTSDLFQYNFDSTREEQPFLGLFQEEKFDAFNPNPENLAPGVFLNSTRANVRNISNDPCM
jgi:hypothetical protein